MHIVAQTPRFVIRNFSPEEEKVYLALFDDEEVTLHLPKRTKEDNRRIFRENLHDYAEGKVLGRWGIFNNGNDEFIGICLLRPYDGEMDKIELGYVLGRNFWGKGIAGEMAQIMVAYAFTHTNANELIGVTTLGNVASQKVLQKAGLERQGNLIRDGEELAFFKLVKGVQ
jgi:ribosomal-protein-alanine N-acetyltransferase